MPSDSEDEDADQVTAVPNLPHISTQRDINVTDTDSDSHGDRMLTRRLRGRQTLLVYCTKNMGRAVVSLRFNR